MNNDTQEFLTENDEEFPEEFSIEEQIDGVRREIDFRIEVLKNFGDEADHAEVEKLKREIRVMIAVKNTLMFHYGIERIDKEFVAAIAENFGNAEFCPALEESKC